MTDIVVIALSLGLEKNHMMRCYGDMVVNPTGGAVRMNFGFAPLVAYAEAFRFKTELNGYKLWVYVNRRVVTHVECISGADYLEDFDPKAYKMYVQSCLSRIIPGPERQNMEHDEKNLRRVPIV